MKDPGSLGPLAAVSEQTGRSPLSSRNTLFFFSVALSPPTREQNVDGVIAHILQETKVTDDGSS